MPNCASSRQKKKQTRTKHTNSATSLELPLSDSLCVLDSSLSLGRLSLVDDVFEEGFFFSGSMAEGPYISRLVPRGRLYAANKAKQGIEGTQLLVVDDDGRSNPIASRGAFSS